MGGRLPIRKRTICSGRVYGAPIDYVENGRKKVDELKAEESVYKSEK
jgi:hypothetical protein